MQIVKPLKHTPQLVISCCPELPACLPCPQTILASLRFRSGAAENLQKLDPAQYAILILWGEISCLFFLSGKKLFTSIIPWLLVFRFSQGINNAIKVTKLFFLFITCCNLKRKKSHLQQSGERQERAENRGLMAEADWQQGRGARHGTTSRVVLGPQVSRALWGTGGSRCFRTVRCTYMFSKYQQKPGCQRFGVYKHT